MKVSATFVHLVLALSALVPLTTAANTLYRCTDSAGVVLYTNQKTSKTGCTVLSQMQAPATSSGPSMPRARASSTPTPGDFPRVSNVEQKFRDSDRKAILDKELANEMQNLEKAKQSYAAAGSQPAEKLQGLRDVVVLHERNIEALKKELGNLR